MGSKRLFGQGECKNNFVHLDLWAGPVFKVYYGFPTVSTYAPKNPTFHVHRTHFIFACATGGRFVIPSDKTLQFDHTLKIKQDFKKPKAFDIPQRRAE